MIKMFVEKFCPICNKRFYPTSMWLYKTVHPVKKTEYYCSYTCWNKGKRRRRYGSY